MELLITLIRIITQLTLTSPTSAEATYSHDTGPLLGEALNGAEVDPNGTGRLGEVHFVR